MEKENAFRLKEGDYVVVVGIHKGKIHILNPNHDIIAKSSDRIKTCKLCLDSFIVDDLLLTPESV